MKNLIFSIALLASFCRGLSENTSIQSDSLKSLLRTAKNDTNKVRILVAMSENFVNSDSYDSAAYYAIQARRLAEQLNFKPGIATSLRRLGISYTCKGQYSISLNFLFLALKVAEEIKDDYLIGKICNSLGSNYSLQKDYDNAQKYFFRSLSFYYNPVVYEDIARTYHLQDKNELSIEYYKKALSYEIPMIEKSYILNDIGDIYEQQEELDTALVYYFKALGIAQKMKNDGSICDIYGSIGDLLIKERRYKEAIFYEDKSSKIAEQINLKNVRWQSEKSLSEVYQLIGNSELSLMHYKIYISVRDSIFNEENTKQNIRSEMNFQFDKQQAIQKVEQDKKDEITIQEKKQQRIIIYSVSAGLFLVLLLAIFIFRGYKQKQKANKKLSEKNLVIKEQHKDITDSIRYAKRIQDAILPPDNFMQEIMPEHLLFFEPKSIVSGDFYFVTKKNEKILWATCDATGHGASASLLTMLGSNILSGIVKDGETDPSRILDKLNERINESLHKTGDDSIRDGMDVTMCSLDKNSMTLNYAGANNPLWLIRNNEIIEYKADKMPIGQMYKNASYVNNEIKLQSGDSIYSFSDGICDLHSEDNKKFMKKRLRELLLSIQDKSMPERKAIISETLKKWKGNADQVDDMLLMGIKI